MYLQYYISSVYYYFKKEKKKKPHRYPDGGLQRIDERNESAEMTLKIGTPAPAISKREERGRVWKEEIERRVILESNTGSGHEFIIRRDSMIQVN